VPKPVQNKIGSSANTFVVIIGMLIGPASLVGIPPIKALYASAILNGLAAPPILVLMLNLLPQERPRPMAQRSAVHRRGHGRRRRDGWTSALASRHLATRFPRFPF
jgi:hypothetical protein